MGKGQRTKGNTRPANSLRSAQLLSSTLGSAPINTFIGFDALKEPSDGAIGNSSIGSLVEEEEVDADFKLIIKQMYKKDSITKIKSLQKFAEYCNEKDYNSVKTVLSMWPRIFNKLAIDNDFRVRETTFQAQEALVKKLGKNIAPILKQIIAIWVVSLHDTYAVSASAAKASFSVSFSPSKQTEVLQFCKEEIINYCKDVLLIQTIATIDDPSTVSTIDREAKYNRLVSASLQTITLLITSISQLESIKDHLDSLINHDNFWKLAKFEDVTVKVNWYRLKSIICEKLPSIIVKNEAKFTSTTLLFIAEKDLLLSAAIWDNVLWILVTIDEWWKHVNLTKGFLPHLRKFIRDGGYGNASTVFPNLLPMLSKFPFNVLENRTKFCYDFIESFEFCILNSNHSTKEYTGIVKAYFECMQYLLAKINSDKVEEELNSTVCERILACVDQMLLNWNDIYCLYLSELTSFISLSKDPELSNNLTNQIETRLLKIVEDSVDEAEKLDLVLKLLSSILRINQERLPRRVKFEEDIEDDQATSEEKTTMKTIIFKGSLFKVWQRLLEMTLTREIQSHWLNSLKMVQELCISVFKEAGDVFPACDYLGEFKDLLNRQANFTSISTRSVNYKHIINLMLNCCTDYSSISEILSYLCSNGDEIMINLLETLPNRIEKDQFLQEWFKSPEISLLLTQTLQSTLDDLDDKVNNNLYLEFVSFAFQVDDIHYPTINTISKMLFDALKNSSSDDHSRHIVLLVKTLLDRYPFSAQLDSTTELILKISQMSLNTCNSEKIPQLYSSTLLNGLKAVLEYNDEEQVSLLFNGLSDLIKEAVSAEDIDWEKSERILEIVNLVLLSVQKDRQTSRQPTYLDKFWNNMLPESDYLVQRVSSIGVKVYFPLWVRGKVLIHPGLNFATDSCYFDYSFTCTIMSITKILKIMPCSTESFNRLLPFACFTLSAMELNSKNLNISHKNEIFEHLTDFVSNRVEHLNRDEMISMLKVLTKTDPEGAIALAIGLGPALRLSSKLSSVNSVWNLTEFDVSSITIFQLLGRYFDPDEIISLSQTTLKFVLCQDDPDKLHQFYGQLSVLNTCLNLVEVPPNDLVCPILDHLSTLKDKKEGALLLECSLDDKSEQAILFTIELMKLYNTIIKKYRNNLTLEQKDLIIISVTAWSITLVSSDLKSFHNPAKMILFCSFCDLFLSIQNAIESQGDSFSSVREWTDFHLIRIARSLVPLLFRLSELDFSGYQLNFISLLGKTISSICIFDVAGLERELQQFNYDEKTFSNLEKAVICPLPKEYESLFFKLNHLYVKKYPAFYLCAHYFSQRLIPMLASSCSDFDNTFDSLAPPKPFLSKLQETDLIVDTLLSDYSLGITCCLIKPRTDSFCYTVAYLLNWLQILTSFSQLNDENRSSLAGFLTDSGYISNLLNNLFKLMPIAPDDQVSDEANFIRNVLTVTRLDELDEDSHIQAISCLVYFHILRKMPACVRMWLSKLDKKTSETVNRFTTSTMSDLICAEEFHAIQNANADKFKNIKVKARHSAKEVVAIYEIEDMSIELTIKFADNHPLTPVTIDGGKRVGVSVPEWRNWLLQVTSFLTHQNGTVLDGLILWNRNMCKRFEGLEECVICYFILHGSNCQLPKLTCRSCKKKFHSACLYKWFEKSNQSSCPLCRNPFVFNKPSNQAGPSNQQQQQQQQQQLQNFN
ncbi:E3 ubiquitin-protein ligase listerin [Tetranychus urticae]|uniref:E3 ubiquitin-protein ligase listerin n=1 Tax=Tetranychus urticae TaxID=32264 RepID=T1KQA6_TETUR|nr:E3 ubiquitin-protein ligase listerin [Tetranychus urticae]XP_015789305.1 E3 ubiquitin-protein ligase listerin [Tetranychus urticae]